jgi:hypothetical protein
MRREYHSAMSRAGNVLASAVGALGVVALLAAGCSSDEAAPATTVAEATVAETTSPPPATDASTTIAPTTTLDPAATLAAQVEADFLEADRLGREASMDPFDAEKEAAALDRRVGFSRQRLQESLAAYRERNYALRPSASTPAVLTIEVPAVVAEASDFAEIQVCEINSWIVVEVGAGPDGSDAIVDPDVVAMRSTIFLRSVDGIWKVEGGQELGKWENEAACPEE